MALYYLDSYLPFQLGDDEDEVCAGEPGGGVGHVRHWNARDDAPQDVGPLEDRPQDVRPLRVGGHGEDDLGLQSAGPPQRGEVDLLENWDAIRANGKSQVRQCFGFLYS